MFECNEKNKPSDIIQYQIIASPEEEIETLESKLNELDSEISNLENTIGNWSLVSRLLLIKIN